MNNSINHRWLAVVTALAWLTFWMWRTALEGNMAVHMAVQLPLLIALGLVLAVVVRPHEPRWLADADWLGIPGIVLVVSAPRSGCSRARWMARSAIHRWI